MLSHSICPKGRDGEKIYVLIVYHCSCQSLGDLSTMLEMTVLGQLFFYKDGRPSREIFRIFSNPLNDRTSVEMTVFWGDRHFDQVKRVEKSPKAKQGLPTTLILSS